MGIIFHIQKFSIHDGPGIRTTIFLKGCPLHCPWCSNPESQNKNIQLVWDHKKCIGCNACIDLGLSDIQFYDSNSFQNTAGKCLTLCSIDEECAKKYKFTCPSGALSYEGYTRSVDEVIKEIVKDIDFYEESKGGITLSGGEVLYQNQFAIEILKKASELNIHTASETTCLCSPEIFKEFVSHLDVLLCDIKHYDEAKHKEIIGCSLNVIDQNIHYATQQSHIKVIGRIPVIPGFNYSIPDAHGLCKCLKTLGIQEVNLLPYHNFGEYKYQLLCLPYAYGTLHNLQKDSDEFIAYMNIFKSYGLQVTV